MDESIGLGVNLFLNGALGILPKGIRSLSHGMSTLVKISSWSFFPPEQSFYNEYIWKDLFSLVCLLYLEIVWVSNLGNTLASTGFFIS